MTVVKRARGRPRKFDPDEVMETIAELFRSKGYAATSLDDISEVTGLTRPSLYAAFGDKLSMYLLAIECFGGKVSAAILPVFERSSGVEETLLNFYQVMLDIYFSGNEETVGCLVFGTAVAAVSEDAVRDKLFDSLHWLDLGLSQVLSRQSDQPDPDAVQAASEIAANTLIALSVRSRAGVSQHELLALCKRSAKVIAGIVS